MKKVDSLTAMKMSLEKDLKESSILNKKTLDEELRKMNKKSLDIKENFLKKEEKLEEELRKKYKYIDLLKNDLELQKQKVITFQFEMKSLKQILCITKEKL